MRKEKRYKDTRYSVDVLREAVQTFYAAGRRPSKDEEADYGTSYQVQYRTHNWYYDTFDQFVTAYRETAFDTLLSISNGDGWMEVRNRKRACEVKVSGQSTDSIELVFDVFETHREKSAIPAQSPEAPVVFIGHGRSSQWRDLKDHLVDKHGVRVEAYETGARAGHTIRDVLEAMAEESSFALLVLTGEDDQVDGSVHARPNVIHETGLFQGKLGFHRAIVLLEEGTQEFSNLAGIQQLRFSKNNIRETFGEVLATLRREFLPVS